MVKAARDDDRGADPLAPLQTTRLQDASDWARLLPLLVLGYLVLPVLWLVLWLAEPFRRQRRSPPGEGASSDAPAVGGPAGPARARPESEPTAGEREP